MKRKIAMIISTSLLILSLSACGDSSVQTIFDEEEEKGTTIEDLKDETQEEAETEETSTEEEETEEDKTEEEETEEEGTEETQTTESDTDTGDNNNTNTNNSTDVEGGTNQNEATMIEVGQEIDGTVSSIQWFSFTTGSGSNLEYQIIITNKTVSSGRIEAYLREKSGTEVAMVYAYSDGVSASINASKLEPDTTYDISIKPSNDETVDFHMVILDLTETSKN